MMKESMPKKLMNKEERNCHLKRNRNKKRSSEKNKRKERESTRRKHCRKDGQWLGG